MIALIEVPQEKLPLYTQTFQINGFLSMTGLGFSQTPQDWSIYSGYYTSILHDGEQG